MTRADVADELEALAARLEADVSSAQTRDQHLRVAQRLAEVRSLLERVRGALAP